MIILDTNVMSELLRPNPSQNVIRWLSEQPREVVYTTAITEAEVLFGVEIMAKGRRRDSLRHAVEGILAKEFEGRILAFDDAAARAYASLAAARRLRGKPISAFDAQIAAIAASHSMAIATRDEGGFEHCGVDLINPWISGETPHNGASS